MHAPPVAPTLTLRALCGQRGERPLFEGLSFAVRPGEVVWLRGRNGRGKTSLLRILAGLSRAEGGYLHIGEAAPHTSTQAWRSHLVYIAHASALKDDLTVAENLRFFARLQGRHIVAVDLQVALSTWGIARLHDAPVRTLSQGQRRRTALARLALPHPPSVWLLDEPFDALDADGVATLNRLLAEQSRRGGSVVFTSHQTPGYLELQPTELDLDSYAVAA